MIISIWTFFLIGSGWLVFKVLVRKDYQTKRKVSFLSILLQLILFFLHGYSFYYFYGAGTETYTPLYFLAIFCMTIGFVLTIGSMVILGFPQTFGLKNKLQTRGVYRFTRNPQIIFFWLLYLGMFMMWPSWSMVLWLVNIIVICHLMVTTEEEHLIQVFGNTYQEYCRVTPRYFWKF